MERTVNFNVSTRFSEIVNEFRNEGETTVIYAEGTNLKAGSDAADTKVARAKELVNTSLRREFGYTKNCTNAIGHITNMPNVTVQGLIDAHKIASAPQAKIEQPEKTPTSSRAEKSSSGSKSEAKVIKEIAKKYGVSVAKQAVLENTKAALSSLDLQTELSAQCAKLMYNATMAHMFDADAAFKEAFDNHRDVFMCDKFLSKLELKVRFLLACYSWFSPKEKTERSDEIFAEGRVQIAQKYAVGIEGGKSLTDSAALVRICNRAMKINCGNAEQLGVCIAQLEKMKDDNDGLPEISKAVQVELSPVANLKQDSTLPKEDLFTKEGPGNEENNSLVAASEWKSKKSLVSPGRRPPDRSDREPHDRSGRKAKHSLSLSIPKIKFGRPKRTAPKAPPDTFVASSHPLFPALSAIASEEDMIAAASTSALEAKGLKAAIKMEELEKEMAQKTRLVKTARETPSPQGPKSPLTSATTERTTKRSDRTRSRNARPLKSESKIEGAEKNVTKFPDPGLGKDTQKEDQPQQEGNQDNG